ncbi:class I SAM-dependent methyltransferase [Planomonospora parontospora]|uniref:class I SAM-dependent methyltransferase n=1 Tax=Planomonospora parontospora TaxID=58119 RepID=UPI001670F416|nr:class I SAM-dependent methyltransferase [Planomonospora parontospora]GGL54862.1 hypothetical protein GCM10014719_65210 [Planomonospora parontospora subsp. antibiotica]GII19284.1 hypothetical protein Ppa05_60100 [Planomonospora parontospora subsp. antibiotica]
MSVEDEYADLDPLQTRIDAHRTHSEHPEDLEAAVQDAIGPHEGGPVLDAGCGTGSFLRRLRSRGFTGTLVGLDISAAATSRVAADGAASAVRGSVTHLPFAAGTFATVTARHMLCHVPDVQAALGEFARVTRPGGRVVISINHPGTVPGVTAMICRQLRRHGLSTTALAATTSSADLPERMARVFPHVQTTAHDNALVFTEPEALIRFAVAVLGIYGLTRTCPARPAIIAAIRQEATAWFARTRQPWRDPKGYVICVGSTPS